MLDQKQIRAARAMLEWTQETLAKRSGIARATIKNVETGLTLPRLETASALQRAFEEAGIEFLPGSGVRMRDRMVQIYEGPDSYCQLINDAFATARDTGSDIIVSPANPVEAERILGRQFLADHVDERRAAGIKQRVLIPSNVFETLTQPPETYRILPKEYWTPYPLYIYGSKIALVCIQEPQKVIVINDERFAEATRKLFNFIWDRTEMPSHKDLEKAKAAAKKTA